MRLIPHLLRDYKVDSDETFGCIQFPSSFCIVNFSTSDFDLKPKVGYFSKTGSFKHGNRKSKSISPESSSTNRPFFAFTFDWRIRSTQNRLYTTPSKVRDSDSESFLDSHKFSLGSNPFLKSINGARSFP